MRRLLAVFAFSFVIAACSGADDASAQSDGEAVRDREDGWESDWARLCEGLVPLLERKLAAEGRTRLLSVSYAFNRPAVRFKEKLNARVRERHVAVELWRRWRRDWRLGGSGA